MTDDKNGNMTFAGPNGASVLDLVWVYHEAAKLVSTFRVEVDSFGSDDFLVQISFQFDHDSPQTEKSSSHSATSKLIWKTECTQQFDETLLYFHRLEINQAKKKI